MSEAWSVAAMHDPCTSHAHAMRMACAALVFGTAVASSGQAQASDPVDQWRAALSGCLESVETGTAEQSPASGWTLADVTRANSHFRHHSGIAIQAIVPVARTASDATVCQLSYDTQIAADDERGQMLADALRELAEGRVVYREEDQFMPSQICRGIAWDGTGFRLASVTRITDAHFTVKLPQRDPACAAPTS